MENDKELVPFLLKDFQEVLRFSEKIMSVLPQNWEELKVFYNNPLRALKIKGAGIKKLKELIDSFSLTSEDYDILHSTIQSYKGVEVHRFFIEDILARSIDIITPTKGTSKRLLALKTNISFRDGQKLYSISKESGKFLFTY